MAATRPISNVLSFTTRPGLGTTLPPSKPTPPKGFGSYCFRATCEVYDDEQLGCPVAKVKGYDTSPAIAKDTETMCRTHAATMGRRYRCGEAQVVLLPHAHMECSGQMVFVMGGAVKRLV